MHRDLQSVFCRRSFDPPRPAETVASKHRGERITDWPTLFPLRESVPQVPQSCLRRRRGRPAESGMVRRIQLEGSLDMRCPTWFLPALVALAGCGQTAVAADTSMAWQAWEAGHVARAGALAKEFLNSPESADEALHLLTLTKMVNGRYADALANHARIDESYDRYGGLDGVVIDCLLHLGRYAEAERFAIKREKPRVDLNVLKLRAGAPLNVSLDGTTVIPFAQHPLAEYFPAFDAEVEGQDLVVHVDTGGTFLIMGPHRAEKLRIELVEAGSGFHGSQRVSLSVGTAKEFKIGAAVLENVPVAVMPTLSGAQDFVIFGTNVLQQFHSTLDYPNRRLILSPRGHAELREQHMAMLPTDRVEVPFHMWGDHYMFAKGSVNQRDDLNFFIDSGLVSLHPGGQGGFRQAAFMSSKQNYAKWGYPPEEINRPVFKSDWPIGLGTLTQDELWFVPGTVGTGKFGGVQMHGLLSHAFLKKYAWTLDFDQFKYVFSVPRTSADVER